MYAMTEADLDQVLEIEQASFKTPWKRSSYKSELSCKSSYNFIVRPDSFCNNRQIISYITFRIITDEMHILKISVAPKWRNHGIASWILRNSFKIASDAGAKTVYLEVRFSNNAAIKFYDKLCFTIIGKRLNYYQEDREDALVMMKKLKEIY
jgi:ribosomal-protein-alanine N-acetyltransferase